MRRMYGMQAEGGNGGSTDADATGAGNPAMGGQHGATDSLAAGQAAAQSAVGVHPAMAVWRTDLMAACVCIVRQLLGIGGVHVAG